MWDFLVILGALLGVILGWENSTFKNDHRYRATREGWPKLMMLGIFGMIIVAETETIRGFLVVYLSSLGAYYLAKPFGELAQRQYYRWRDLNPEIHVIRTPHNAKEIGIRIHPRTASPINVETIRIFGKNNESKKIDGIELKGCDYESDSLFSCFNLRDFTVQGNGYGNIALVSGGWDGAGTLYISGKYSNDVHWVVLKAIDSVP
jgi:hypothetical protein